MIGGLHDFLKSVNKSSKLLGFVGGTEGIYEQNVVEVTEDVLALYRNQVPLLCNYFSLNVTDYGYTLSQGGFDLLGRTVDKLRTPEQLEATKNSCTKLKLDGLILIGGVRTNTDAAHLAEYFAANKVGTVVVGVPGGIDGSFKNQFVETSFGFDTACKVYSQLIGNIATDGNSAKKYYYFCRLMGNAPSHINLECALQTHPNFTVLSEEVAAKKKSLVDITMEISDSICKRAAAGKNFGTVLLPEGLVASIPEMSALIDEINALIKEGVANEQELTSKLTPWGAALLRYLPPFIREQLLLERESAGTVQLSQIETERLLAWTVGQELNKRKQAKAYVGNFSCICSFFGYQARCSMPSNFDAKFANALGQCAASLVYHGYNGYLANVTGLTKPVEEWKAGGVPLYAMTTTAAKQSMVSGKIRPTIPMTLVDTHGVAFQELKKHEAQWEMDDCYENPGPIQFNGPCADLCTHTLAVEDHDYTTKLEFLRNAVSSIQHTCRPGCSDDVLGAATASLKTLTDVLAIIRKNEAD